MSVTLLAALADSRRVTVRPADDSEAAPQQQDDEQVPFKPVLIARRPLQTRPLAATDVETERQPVQVIVRQAPRLLQQRPRDEIDESADEQPPQTVAIRQPSKSAAQRGPQQQLIQQQQHRLKEPQQQQAAKEPTAQTIRNYNKLNDDGSFTFGYEADDGSFKEETRGTDCVVRGKYGYVDPDGNKREFSYVQGNPCDPNASVAEDEEEQPGKPGEEENIPINVPRPRPAAPKKTRPATTLFQQTFGDFEQPSTTTARQPGRLVLEPSPSPSPSPRRPQISPTTDRPSSTFAPGPQFRPTQNLESAIRDLPQPVGSAVAGSPNSPLYTTELVFDPATGQYNTVIFQQVPKQQAGITLNQRLPLAPARQQFQPQPAPQPQFQPQFRPQPAPQFQPNAPLQQFQPPQFQTPEFDFQRPAAFNSPSSQQQLVQQQQALTFQQSQNLFRQQQKQQQQPFKTQSAQFFPPPSQRFAALEPQRFAAEQPQQFKPQRFEPQPEAHQQQFVLVQPGRTPGQQNLAAGQIDAFLRGHNVQF